MNDILGVKTRNEKGLLALVGVTGVGVISSSPERIIVYVKDVASALKVPSKVEDIPVVGIVTGTVRALNRMTVSPLSMQALAAARTDRWRPAPGGCSIAHFMVTAGTLSVLTRDGYILSNNHVNANSGQGMVGDPILQPGKFDGGKDPDDRIGTLYDFVELQPEPAENLVDCSIVKPDNPADVSPEILDVGQVYGWGEVNPHQTVEKSGRTTGLTSTTVMDTNASMKIEGYPFGTALFVDQIVFGNPNWIAIAPGDSGSLLFSRVSGTPIAAGLCFAGSEEIGLANKIKNVIEQQKIDLGPQINLPIPNIFDAIPSFIPFAVPLAMIITSEYGKIVK